MCDMTVPTGLIEAQQITRRDASSGKTLLTPTDFSLAAGSRIAITGASGSGKSVLLRALALL
ncbi:ATP-binding cassette domain-containing protein, partial [Paraburkholderia sp. SIMBA_030]|uniref:ATP-binding cassette domain-containing protein n=1 Tax=Paraburkholderia sp. SIMBA_030 TaxID=3085773 RepID=UPI00397AFF91